MKSPIPQKNYSWVLDIGSRPEDKHMQNECIQLVLLHNTYSSLVYIEYM